MDKRFLESYVGILEMLEGGIDICVCLIVVPDYPLFAIPEKVSRTRGVGVFYIVWCLWDGWMLVFHIQTFFYHQ